MKPLTQQVFNCFFYWKTEFLTKLLLFAFWRVCGDETQTIFHSTLELCVERPAVERRSGHGGGGKLGVRTLCFACGTSLEDEPPAFVPVFHVRSVTLAVSGRSAGVVRPPCPREELYSPLGISTEDGWS